MMKSVLLIVLIGGTAFIHPDIRSPLLFYSVALPVIDLLALVALGVWFVVLFYRLGIGQTTRSGSGDPGGFGGFDGDGRGDSGC